MKLLLPIFLVLNAVSLYSQTADIKAYEIGEIHTIHSTILNEDRDIFIHVPKGFWGMDEEMKNYPIAIVLDGESQFEHTVAAIDFLSAAPMGNDLMPRTIVVGIPNTNRNRDLTPKKGKLGRDPSSDAGTGGGQLFLEFITTELIPYISNHFSTGSHRTIIGHSLGGLIVFEALLNYNDHFDNYLAIDPALRFDSESYFNHVIEKLNSEDYDNEKVYIAKANTIPTFLDISQLANDTSEIVEITQSNIKMQKLVAECSWKVDVKFQDFPNENHFSVPYPATFEGMKFFYDYYPFPEILDYYHPAYKDRSDLLEKLKSHYQNISLQLGHEVIPMESYINSWAHGIAHFGRDDLAIALFDYNIELYATHSSVYNTKGNFMMNIGNEKEAIQLFQKSLTLKEDQKIRKKLEELMSK